MAQGEQTRQEKLVGSAKHLVRPSRAAEAIALLDRWLSDETDYDEKTWLELKAALDRECWCGRTRLSDFGER